MYCSFLSSVEQLHTIKYSKFSVDLVYSPHNQRFGFLLRPVLCGPSDEFIEERERQRLIIVRTLVK